MTDVDALVDILIENVVRVVAREMGPINLIARVDIEKAVRGAIFEALDHNDDGWWDGDDDDEPEPDPPLPPDDGPKVNLREVFKLDVIWKSPVKVDA